MDWNLQPNYRTNEILIWFKVWNAVVSQHCHSCKPMFLLPPISPNPTPHTAYTCASHRSMTNFGKGRHFSSNFMCYAEKVSQSYPSMSIFPMRFYAQSVVNLLSMLFFFLQLCVIDVIWINIHTRNRNPSAHLTRIKVSLDSAEINTPFHLI